MLRFLICCIFICSGFQSVSRDSTLAVLRNNLESASTDSARYVASFAIYTWYEEFNRDSAIFYANKCYRIAASNNKKLNAVISLSQLSYQQINTGLFDSALQNLTTARELASDPDNEKYLWKDDTLSSAHAKRLTGLAYANHMFGVLLWRTQNFKNEIPQYLLARELSREAGNMTRYLLASMNLGRAYTQRDQLDSALFYETEAKDISISTGYPKYLSFMYFQLGVIHLKLRDTAQALPCFYRSIELGREQHFISAEGRSYNELTQVYLAKNKPDSALFYAKLCLEQVYRLGSLAGTEFNIGIGLNNMFRAYEENHQKDSALKYASLTINAKDRGFQERITALGEFQNLTFNQQLRLREMDAEKEKYRDKIKTWFLLSGIAVMMLVAFLLFRNNMQKRKAKDRIERAYADLQATQTQLIQSEKMASLGELTAGIAHEIQNPLNFVNNFSELNKDLLTEMKTELVDGNSEEVITIADDVIHNEEKIRHHGKRADAIVKSMLLHSRKTADKFEPTALNSLVEEHGQLAFHAFGKSENNLHIEFETQFDPKIGDVKINPQEIGRVLLNLFNNAFYACTERSRSGSAELRRSTGTELSRSSSTELRRSAVNEKSFVPGYAAKIKVQTIHLGKTVQVRVSDNGSGMSPKVVEKIFQPFFTTKPTGQGTGLGLSVSYDIIAKGHKGILKAESVPGVGTTMVIELPAV